MSCYENSKTYIEQTAPLIFFGGLLRNSLLFFVAFFFRAGSPGVRKSSLRAQSCLRAGLLAADDDDPDSGDDDDDDNNELALFISS